MYISKSLYEKYTREMLADFEDLLSKTERYQKQKIQLNAAERKEEKDDICIRILTKGMNELLLDMRKLEGKTETMRMFLQEIKECDNNKKTAGI